MTARQNKPIPFIRPKKWFACLTFITEGDRQKFVHNENVPIYNITRAVLWNCFPIMLNCSYFHSFICALSKNVTVSKIEQHLSEQVVYNIM